MSADDLVVVMEGEVIGDLHRSGRRSLRLRYDAADPDTTPLSLSLPLTTRRHREAVVVPWLDGLLPDRPETVRQWRRQFGIAGDLSAFALLRHVGEDVAGAAQFVRQDRVDEVCGGVGMRVDLSDADVADMLRRALADLPSGGHHTAAKFSLAGAQAKIALHRTTTGWSDPSGAVPSTHIVKPAIPGLVDQDLVETVTQRAAVGIGLRAARADVVEFDDLRAVVVERYDRVELADGWRRVHQEDMCQALGVSPRRKYESQGGPSSADVASLIHRASDEPEQDNRRFAQALIFNWLVCGTDAHARNHSLLLRGRSARLAPLYDLNSHLAYSQGREVDLSMSTNSTFHASHLTLRDWLADAAKLHVDPDWLSSEIERQIVVLLPAFHAASASADIARFDSPVLARLISNLELWLAKRA